ncbi:protein of unknown function [Bradyrhizobium vignae]|uniref:Uncharacterized protein n=1 Tax=Bradyrhizobium vignae TaxID=1549949 RepID=A0A2U3PW61_9BRAD|nr:protein of unknown function [Bradyrhizobium vignae]
MPWKPSGGSSPPHRKFSCTGACDVAESQTPVLAVPYAVGNVVLTVLGPIVVAATFEG